MLADSFKETLCSAHASSLENHEAALGAAEDKTKPRNLTVATLDTQQLHDSDGESQAENPNGEPLDGISQLDSSSPIKALHTKAEVENGDSEDDEVLLEPVPVSNKKSRGSLVKRKSAAKQKR